MAKNVPTKEQAQEFHEYMLYWQGVLSLGDWRVERVNKRPQRGAMAEVHFDDEQRLVSYRLGDWGGGEITPHSLKETALHEMLHVLLHDTLTAAQDRAGTPEQVATAEHRVINLLERLLMRQEDGAKAN